MWDAGTLFDESLEHGDWYDDGLFSDELYHHGIKGQKWGVRRTPEQLGRVKAALKPGHERRMNYYKTRNAAAKANRNFVKTLTVDAVKDTAKQVPHRIKGEKKETEQIYKDYKKKVSSSWDESVSRGAEFVKAKQNLKMSDRAIIVGEGLIASNLAGQASKVVVGPLVKAKYSKRY